MSELMIQDTGIYAKAELDVQISTAKAYPRNQTTFISDAIMLATLNQDTAESCFYCLARTGQGGKSEIKGGSIRLAEIVASCWGNIHAGSRIIENDGKCITAQGVAWDLEKNVKLTREVKRKITNKEGRTYSEDMQTVTGNAACSIALRNAIFAVVPKALVDCVYDAAVKFSVGDQRTFPVIRKEKMDKIIKMGIEPAKVLAFFNRKSIEEIDADDLRQIIGIGTSIKDGIISIDKAFSAEYMQDDSTEGKLKSLLDSK
jgi:hypothetical protein